MSYRKDLPKSFGDMEKPYEAVADSFDDGARVKPLTVRLGDLWNDLYRSAHERPDLETPRDGSAVPRLDDMKGILQWD
jgi:hypothetical protein